MSVLLHLTSPYDRLSIEQDDGTVWIRSRNEYGLTDNTVSLRLTSADRDTLRAALDKLDTTAADADLADEREAA